jgi:hypothetical protein
MRSLQSKLSIAFLAMAALVLGSCGGGGATSSPAASGTLALTPLVSNFYAGVPYTINIVGGRKPYLVTSSEQTLIALNFTTNENQFTVVPNNPGVVNVGLDPNEVPRRSVNVEVRDSNGAIATSTYQVLQNFYTGYGDFYSSTCAATSGGTTPQACSGTDSIVSFAPVSNGLLYANREFVFDKVRGDYSFVVEDPAVTPQLVNQIRVRSDSSGRARVRLRVNANAPTQFATYRVTDTATGAMVDAGFTIVFVPPTTASTSPISILPSNTVTFTGSLNTQCGRGTADVFVFGGTPPYRILPTNGVTVSATTLAAAGDRLSITAGGGAPPCQTGQAVIVTDATGAAATITVAIVAGTGTVTVPPITVAPSSIPLLLCGMTSQATTVGGNGVTGITSTHPRIVTTVSGTTVSITRATGDGAAVFPTTGTVVLTDGASTGSIVISSTPANCP